MIKVKSITTVFVAGTLTLATLVGWSMRNKLFHKATAPARIQAKIQSDTINRVITYDTALLKKFTGICSSFNMQGKALTYSGIVDVTDGADTSHNIKNLSFFYSRKGNDYYYKNGSTETLNADGIYLYIEHDQKRVLIADQKKILNAPLPDMSDIPAKLRSKHYNLVYKKTGDYETISLLNEHHISCKEYAITFDTLSHKMSNVLIRLTCFDDPLNKKKDKVVNMKVAFYENKANAGSFPDKGSTVLKDGDSWKLTSNYAHYELINVTQ